LAQAHISNFLHNRRHQSMNALDRVLTAQQLEAENLLLPSSAGVVSDPSTTWWSTSPSSRTAPQSPIR
jgi:hypothetical protein